MSTEQLIIELDAKTAKLDAKLSSVERKLDDVDSATKKADGSLKKIGSVAGIAGAAILKTAAAATALAGAITAIVLSSASGRRELELLAKQAKTSTEDFQALSFATSRYGINAEQIADISKDIADKVGEFSAAGTGAFQDYADVMKLTKDEAREAAKEFEGLSSQEILGTMVSRMEEASVSGDKMTFVLESLGSDSSRLIPLFKGNSKELIELKKRFDDVNKSLQITGTQAAALDDVSNTFTLLTSSTGNAATAISATLAPVLDDFFNDIIDIVPDATQTIVNFINSFLDAENITSKSGVNKQIEESVEKIDRLTAQINSKRQRGKELLKDQRDAERERLALLGDQLLVLEDQEKKLEDVKRLSGGEIGGETGEDLSGKSLGLGTGDEIQAIEDRFKSEELLLAEKLVRELQITGYTNDLKVKLEQEFADNIKSIREKSRETESKANSKELSDLAKAEKKAADQKLNSQQSAVNAGMALNTLLFDDNKAIAAGLIVADTATAIMRSLSISPYDYLNVGVIAATGSAQLANALSSSKGGGSISTPSGGTPQESQPAQDFTPETTSLEFTDSGEGGSAQQVVRFEAAAGDDVMEAIVAAFNKAQQTGRA